MKAKAEGGVQEAALSRGTVLLRSGGPRPRPWLRSMGRPGALSLGCLETMRRTSK